MKATVITLETTTSLPPACAPHQTAQTAITNITMSSSVVLKNTLDVYGAIIIIMYQYVENPS
jgi:hypothetical protein